MKLINDFTITFIFPVVTRYVFYHYCFSEISSILHGHSAPTCNRQCNTEQATLDFAREAVLFFVTFRVFISVPSVLIGLHAVQHR